jgi:hypothetical protein
LSANQKYLSFEGIKGRFASPSNTICHTMCCEFHLKVQPTILTPLILLAISTRLFYAPIGHTCPQVFTSQKWSFLDSLAPYSEPK